MASQDSLLGFNVNSLKLQQLQLAVSLISGSVLCGAHLEYCLCKNKYNAKPNLTFIEYWWFIDGWSAILHFASSQRSTVKK